jgi:hypothetical protein
MEPLTAKEARRRRSTRHPALCRDCQQISTQPSERNASWMSAHATPVANQMTLAPALGPIGGIRPGLVSRTHRPHRATIHDRSRPINLVITSQPVQQGEVHQIPNAGLLPVAQAPPARHPRTTAELLRQHLPRNATAKDKENAGEARASDTRGCPPLSTQAPKHPSTQAPKHLSTLGFKT